MFIDSLQCLYPTGYSICQLIFVKPIEICRAVELSSYSQFCKFCFLRSGFPHSNSIKRRWRLEMIREIKLCSNVQSCMCMPACVCVCVCVGLSDIKHSANIMHKVIMSYQEYCVVPQAMQFVPKDFRSSNCCFNMTRKASARALR